MLNNHFFNQGQLVYHHPEGDITFQPRRGVKECPMSLHLFMPTYEILIRELQERPQAKVFVYMDGIMLSQKAAGQQMHDTIHAMQDILPLVGMQRNAKKTQIYQRALQMVQHSIQGIPVQPPVPVYLGRHIAHQSYQKLARQSACKQWT